MSDRIFDVVGLVFAALYIWAAWIIPDSFVVDVIGPRAFPYIVGAVLAIASLYFLLRPDSEPSWPELRDFMEIVFAAAAMFLYAWVLSEIGFVISTVFATAYLTWRLGTRPTPALATGIATSGGIYVVFHLVLGLSLARGPSVSRGAVSWRSSLPSPTTSPSRSPPRTSFWRCWAAFSAR